MENNENKSILISSHEIVKNYNNNNSYLDFNSLTNTNNIYRWFVNKGESNGYIDYIV